LECSKVKKNTKMELKHTRLDEKILKLNTIIDFIELNILEKSLRNRYIKVLRHQKALIRDIDRKGRKIPENTPFVCEITGCEVNSIREREPSFKLEPNIGLGHSNDFNGKLLRELISSDIEHNSYSHLLNNYSIKGIKKMLGRKIVFDDLSNVEDNIIFIMEIFKHTDYFKKYIDVKTFEKRINDIQIILNEL
jgi:hypothetical protein